MPGVARVEDSKSKRTSRMLTTHSRALILNVRSLCNAVAVNHHPPFIATDFLAPSEPLGTDDRWRERRRRTRSVLELVSTIAFRSRAVFQKARHANQVIAAIALGNG
jgi:hypothetical protein